MSEEQRKIFRRMDYVPDLSQEGEDLFESKKTAESLVENYLYNMESPNAFGVYGGWGSGKTTIMRGMEEKLKQDGHEENIVWFEPWKYEREDDLGVIYALIQEIAGDYRGEALDQVWKGLLVPNFRALLNSTDVNLGLFKFDLGAFDPTKTEEYDQSFQNTFQKWKSSTDDLKKNFAKIIQYRLEKDGSSEVYIFLDDLDRCLPENVIKIFEVIKHFLAVEGVIFIIGADNTVIEHYIDKRYQSPDQGYLDKVIPYSKELRRKDLKKFIELYFKEFDFEIDKEKKDQVISLLISFSNIRKVRNVLQEFLIVQKKIISRDSNSKLKDEDLVPYFSWLIMKEFFTELNFNSKMTLLESLIQKKWIEEFYNSSRGSKIPGSYELVDKDSVKSDLLANLLQEKVQLKDGTGHFAFRQKFLDVMEKCQEYDDLVYPQVFNVEINESLSLEENLTTS